MVQRLRAFVAHEEDLSSVPNNHILHNHLYLQFQELYRPFLTSVGSTSTKHSHIHLINPTNNKIK